MSPEGASASALLARAEAAWAAGDGDSALAFFGRAADLAEEGGDLETRVAAVLGLARGQAYNQAPGLLPVRLHSAYDAATGLMPHARLAAALARCWAYANEPTRAQPFAREAMTAAEGLGDPRLLADALDAALAAHWGPDDLALRREWALRLGDVTAHLADPDTRLQAHLWELTVAWEVLDLPRMHRALRAVEQLAELSPRARFFAATRRLPLELLRQNGSVARRLLELAEAAAGDAVIPDAEVMLHGGRAYLGYFTADVAGCRREAPYFEEYAVANGVATVRAEAAVIWLGARDLAKVAEMVGAFTPSVLEALPHDSDWLLTLQCVLEGALAVEDRVVTEAAARLLRPYAGRSVVNAGAVMWHGVTDDTLARAAALQGDAEAAAHHREAALAAYERVGATWWRDRLREALPGTDASVVHFHEQPGGLWLVGRPGMTFVLPPMRGLAHLHRLLAEPGRDLAALALAGGEIVDQSGLELLDEEARRAYLARLDDPDADPDERAWLIDQLGAATGLAGRRRRTGSSDERARVAVRKAVVAALARIAEADPWLGRHLHDRVRTGSECRYESDPDHPVRWLLQASR